MNKKSSDVRGIGLSDIDLICLGCGKKIKAGKLMKIFVCYNYYYDYAAYYHLSCSVPPELPKLTGAH